MKMSSKEEAERVLLFLQQEAQMDRENFAEMLKIEPSHLSKTKIKAMERTGKSWAKNSASLIKKIRARLKQKNEWDRIDYFGKERTWLKQ